MGVGVVGILAECDLRDGDANTREGDIAGAGGILLRCISCVVSCSCPEVVVSSSVSGQVLALFRVKVTLLRLSSSRCREARAGEFNETARSPPL
jgi:hypothetical protein